MQYEVWFFIGLFVFIFVVWAAIGGPGRGVPLRPPAFPSVDRATTTRLWETRIALPRALFTIGTSSPDGGERTSGPDTSVAPFIRVPGVTFSASSPYRGIVSLSPHVSNANAADARTEYVRLSVAESASAPVNITGWRLVSGATDRQASIPRGTAVLTAGVVNQTRDILLRPGDEALIISGKSPLGVSFRENECIGYFGSFQTFTPSLPKDCPSAADDLASFYGTSYIREPACIDYADTLSRCQVVTRVRSTKLTSACRSFLETHMNYNGCVDAHETDADFGGTLWRIYLGRDTDEPLWRERHEVVELLDHNGYTIDAFAY